jgi:hypothetical protein
VLSDLTDFIADHRPHRSITADATELAWNGYLVTVACPCRAVFEQWVTLADALDALISWSDPEVSKT